MVEAGAAWCRSNSGEQDGQTVEVSGLLLANAIAGCQGLEVAPSRRQLVLHATQADTCHICAAVHPLSAVSDGIIADSALWHTCWQCQIQPISAKTTSSNSGNSSSHLHPAVPDNDVAAQVLGLMPS